jgi:predicted AAA+ superfamily ATPase
MATSNRDRVGRGFEVLAAGLAPFVDQHMSAAAPAGADWVQMLETRDEQKFGTSKTYSASDPRFLLRVMTEEWRAFKDSLSRVDQSFASELRDAGNKWAHNTPFSGDDTYRVLDTMERLLTAAGAPDEAEKARKLRLDHQRQAYEVETRKAAKAVAEAPTVEGMGLKPWREVIRPHDDVATGNFSASEFAADLHRVQRGEGSPEYVDPVEFFRRTYLTAGLRDLLSRAVRRIGGDMNASPVENLQTTFGGGKTHSMLALWHLFSGRDQIEFPQEVQDLLADTDLASLGRQVRRVALVGNHISPGNGVVKDDGTHVKTLWGELAWQLGGPDAYQIMSKDDQTRTPPGDALRELITQYSPCLILIDEWVAYARVLYGREDLAGGSFESQFTFAQTLTETVSGTPGAMLVISIPASHDPAHQQGEASALEVGGPNGREALVRLQHAVRRVASPWTPATAQESFEIVRRRLFEEPDGASRGDIAAVARKFVEFYRERRGEFPSEAGEPAYESRIKAAYPIHPELFDRLYEDWSTLEKFQRTRGVLRLLSTVVHALWAGGDASPMILPGTLPLEASQVVGELTQYLDDAWKPIVDADVDGEGSTPVAIDVERPLFGSRAMTRRLARTTFVGSAATLQSAHKGIERQNVWLGAAIPGDTVGNFGSALQMLSDRATYLYVDGQRYWYDTQQSVSRTAKDYAERLHPEDVWAEIERRLHAETRVRGDFVGVHVAPSSSGDVPDTEEARLVILGPTHAHTRNNDESAALRFARTCLETRGTGQRTNRNMLVFLAADSKRLEELDLAVRDFLAWQDINGRVAELNLSPQQASMAESRLANAEQAVTLRIAGTYHWALVPVQPQADRPLEWEVVKAEGSKERLAERTSDKLKTADLLRVVHGARVIRQDLSTALASVWEHGHVSVGELWSYHCRYPYLARLKNRSVLDEGVLGVLTEFTWELEGFALATGYDEAAGRYLGLALPHEDAFGQITDTTLLVDPPLAKAQREAEHAAAGAATGEETGTTPTPGGSVEITVAEPEAEPIARNVRFYGVHKLDPERYGRDWTKIAQEVLQHLASVEDVQLEVHVEITATTLEGFPDDKVRIVTENAKVIKFEQFGFEDS